MGSKVEKICNTDSFSATSRSAEAKKLYKRQKRAGEVVYKLYTRWKHSKSARIQYVYDEKMRWRAHIHIVYGSKTFKVTSCTICIRGENALASSYTNCIRLTFSIERSVYSFFRLYFLATRFFKKTSMQRRSTTPKTHEITALATMPRLCEKPATM